MDTMYCNNCGSLNEFVYECGVYYCKNCGNDCHAVSSINTTITYTGWQCPICKVVWAPYYPRCTNCKTVKWSPEDGTRIIKEDDGQVD